MPHWFSDSPTPIAICQKSSVCRTDTGRGEGKLTGPHNQHSSKQTCAYVAIMLTLLANVLHRKTTVA